MSLQKKKKVSPSCNLFAPIWNDSSYSVNWIGLSIWNEFSSYLCGASTVTTCQCLIVCCLCFQIKYIEFLNRWYTHFFSKLCFLLTQISELKVADIPDVDLSSCGVTSYGSFSVEVIDPVSDYLELLEVKIWFIL